MEYKKTAEYAFDLMEHFYNLNRDKIEEVGTDKLRVLVPLEIYILLERTDGTYPTRYRHMDMESTTGNLIIFALK